MKVIIPAAGKGQRFKDAGYTEHKPLIRVAGDQNIIDMVLAPLLAVFNPDDIIVIVRQDDTELHQYLLQNYPLTHRVKVGPHAGAADAVRIALHKMGEHLDAPASFRDLFIINSDQYLSFGEVRGFVGAVLSHHGNTATQVFNSPTSDSKWSFVKTEESDDICPVLIVTQVVEKEKISDWANTGFYWFGSSEAFLDAFENSVPMANGEHYIAPLLKQDDNFCLAFPLLADGAHGLRTFHGLGTPEDLKLFQSKIGVS